MVLFFAKNEERKDMKKTLLMAGIASLVAVNANATEYLPYVAARFARVTVQNDISSTQVNRQLDDEQFGYRVAAGVMVPLCGGLAQSVRAEVEYGLLNKTHNSITAAQQNVTMQTKLQTAFLNLYYDLDTSTSLTPYFGFGLGYAHINEKAFEKVSEDNFAYNVGAGVSFNFSYNTDFELGYRYTNYKKIKERTPDDYAKRDYDSHEVLLGIRYTF